MKTVRTILLGLAIIAAVGLYCYMVHDSIDPEPLPTAIHISNITEIQEQLRDAGYYNGFIDGKWGPQTDRAYCNYQAAKYFKKEGG